MLAWGRQIRKSWGAQNITVGGGEEAGGLRVNIYLENLA